jgi:leader peptidase (prepilin peptidase)/N-methyltransferase
LEALVSAALIALLLWGVGEAYFRIRKVEGLGFGDVKMVAMLAAFLGIGGALQVIFIASVMGALAGGAYIYFQGKKANSYPLPFGTFLGLAGLAVAFFGR